MLESATQKNSTAVIVGANVTGGRAAEALRAAGHTGRIILSGAEPELPYERPPLSKGFLTGKVPVDDIMLRSPAYYDEHAIELQTGTRAVSLDPRQRSVTLNTGDSLAYDTLLIATGAHPRPLNIPGASLDGVHYFRTLADARHIRERLRSTQRVVVIGMGFIGAEIAAACRELGHDVIALEAGAVPMQAALGTEVAQRLAAIHREHGVDLRTQQDVTAILGTDHVTHVISNGQPVACDMVVIGVGVVPNIDWLHGSGIELDGGVVTDAQCRTSLPDVFAAGDVARQYHPRYGRHLLIEHFDHAANQGVAAARSMLGQPVPDIPLPFFWTDQYDLNIQVAGLTTDHDQIVFRGMETKSSWSAFYLQQGTFVAALAVNRFRDLSAARRILTQNIPVSAAELADENIELRSLLARSGG